MKSVSEKNIINVSDLEPILYVYDNDTKRSRAVVSCSDLHKLEYVLNKTNMHLEWQKISVKPNSDDIKKNINEIFNNTCNFINLIVAILGLYNSYINNNGYNVCLKQVNNNYLLWFQRIQIDYITTIIGL